jgi:hypothetical protein
LLKKCYSDWKLSLIYLQLKNVFYETGALSNKTMLLLFEKAAALFLGVVPKLGCAPTDKKRINDFG